MVEQVGGRDVKRVGAPCHDIRIGHGYFVSLCFRKVEEGSGVA